MKSSEVPVTKVAMDVHGPRFAEFEERFNHVDHQAVKQTVIEVRKSDEMRGYSEATRPGARRGSIEHRLHRVLLPQLTDLVPEYKPRAGFAVGSRREWCGDCRSYDCVGHEELTAVGGAQ